MRHCKHCYEEGYKAGLAATKKTEEPEVESTGPQQVRITLTDELRFAYGIQPTMDEAIAIVDGDRIVTILSVYKTENTDE